jgi:hypothetical protein
MSDGPSTTVSPVPPGSAASASAPPPPSAPLPQTLAAQVMEWSRPVIALFSLLIFAVAFWIAWVNKDTQTFSILVGAIVSLVSSVAGYYFGSSAGSQKKDDVIHAALMTAQGTPPPPGG